MFEDGRPQLIAAFRHGDEPITLGLIVDRSQSMQSKTPAVLAALSGLLQSGRPDTALFGVDFNDRVSLALRPGETFTNDGDELRAAVIAVPAEGRTALYDGVIRGLLHLQQLRADRKVLIVLSDGGDNASQGTSADVLALAHRSDVISYAIGLLGGPLGDDEQPGVLKRLCRDTGGAAYFPRTIAEVADVSAEIAHSLRDQYTLGFVPRSAQDGPVLRRITVKVVATGRGRLRVRARSGYARAP